MLQTLLAGCPTDPACHVAALPHAAVPTAPAGLLAMQVHCLVVLSDVQTNLDRWPPCTAQGCHYTTAAAITNDVEGWKGATKHLTLCVVPVVIC